MIDCNGLARIERKNIALFVKSRAVQTISPLPPFDQSYDNQIRITDGLFYLFIYFAYIIKRNNELGENFIFYYVFFIYLFISLISFVYRTSVGNAFMLSHWPKSRGNLCFEFLFGFVCGFLTPRCHTVVLFGVWIRKIN